MIGYPYMRVLSNYALFVFIIIISLSTTKSTPTKEQFVKNARYDLFADEDDYLDEILNGHQIRDTEKFKRQQGCLCVEHFKDPHCGSDLKTYDNGCFFLCAQKRNPDLRLKRWGDCHLRDYIFTKGSTYKEINIPRTVLRSKSDDD